MGGFHGFRCHVGHAFSLGSVVGTQAESVERAFWSAARALEETASLAQRLASSTSGAMHTRFEEKEQEQRRQAYTQRTA